MAPFSVLRSDYVTRGETSRLGKTAWIGFEVLEPSRLTYEKTSRPLGTRGQESLAVPPKLDVTSTQKVLCRVPLDCAITGNPDSIYWMRSIEWLWGELQPPRRRRLPAIHRLSGARGLAYYSPSPPFQVRTSGDYIRAQKRASTLWRAVFLLEWPRPAALARL